ncbi:MAG TPA: hypothetical protein VMF87_23510 [Streptosporangiaceae bacterium]|nr:hypothetical protein [Streptosporangiaceae bacterium]
MMTQEWSAGALVRRSRWRLASGLAIAALTCGSLAVASSASASPRPGQDSFLRPGNLLVSGSYYDVNPDALVPGVTVLPPGCTTGCVTATNNAAYPQVFNNVLVDPSFGITTPIMLDQITPSGRLVSRIQVPDGTRPGDHAVTSFSSKSELALNLSTDGRDVTMMGYVATPGTVDVSNANTPAVIDPTNPVPGAYYRAVVQLDQQGRFSFTETNAYSGDNGRAAILNDSHGQNVYYMAGNAGNGSNPQPDGVILGAGAQIATPQSKPERVQQPGQPAPVGSFNVTQLGDKADKIGKDTNFRGLTVYDNVVYLTKGSGSNGVNTVYFIDTTGKACPNGAGVPQPGAPLPTSPIAYNASLLQTDGVTPYNMCVLQGFPTTLAKSTTSFPFGMWFANKDTVYVADEGNGDDTYSTSTGTYTGAAAQTTAGLQKWVFNGTSWDLAYTLTAGLNLGDPYTVPGYPTGDNAATGLPWAPATDGLRNITGRVNPDGTVTIYAVTSTVSGGGDQGADPNKLVAITDSLPATTVPAAESFRIVRAAGFGEVLRGVSFTPGTEVSGR